MLHSGPDFNVFSLPRNDIPKALDFLRQKGDRITPEEWQILLQLQNDSGTELMKQAGEQGLLPAADAR